MKTNHKTGYHKPVKNQTTNAMPDAHSEFCRRCKKHNKGCPLKMAGKSSSDCYLKYLAGGIK